MPRYHKASLETLFWILSLKSQNQLLLLFMSPILFAPHKVLERVSFQGIVTVTAHLSILIVCIPADAGLWAAQRSLGLSVFL